jgi:hypothetical protein
MGAIFKKTVDRTFEEKLACGAVVAVGNVAQRFLKTVYQLHSPSCIHPCKWTAQRKSSQGLVETHAVLAKAFEATSQQISLEEFEKFVKTGSNFCYTGRVRRSCSIEHIDAVNRRKLL